MNKPDSQYNIYVKVLAAIGAPFFLSGCFILAGEPETIIPRLQKKQYFIYKAGDGFDPMDVSVFMPEKSSQPPMSSTEPSPDVRDETYTAASLSESNKPPSAIPDTTLNRIPSPAENAPFLDIPIPSGDKKSEATERFSKLGIKVDGIALASGSRKALIDSHLYSAGDFLPLEEGGVRIESIEENAVILSYSEVLFQIPAPKITFMENFID